MEEEKKLPEETTIPKAEATPAITTDKTDVLSPVKIKKRWPWILGLAIIVVLAVFGGGVYYALTTPQYSMWQMQKAFQKKDVAQAQKYIDVTTVADQVAGVVAEIAKKAIQDQFANNADATDEEKQQADQYFASMLPQLKTELASEFQKNFESSVNGATVQGDNPFDALGAGKGKAVFKKDGGDYLLTVSEVAGLNYSVVFRLQKKNSFTWQIVAIENINEIIQSLQDQAAPAQE